MNFAAGIDIGSVYTKCSILHEQGVVSRRMVATGINPSQTAEEILSETLGETKIARNQLKAIVTTGYGRHSVKFADKRITEILAAGIGANFYLKQEKKKKDPCTIIDLGGQDSKVISLDAEGKVSDFLMNDKCAAGTGKFLEVMCEKLEVDIEEMAQLASQSQKKVRINSTCTVFAESEVISLLARGEMKEDIIAGIHSSITGRLANMVRKVGAKGTLLFVGGGARNSALANELEKDLGQKLLIPDNPQFFISLGAAQTALELA